MYCIVIKSYNEFGILHLMVTALSGTSVTLTISSSPMSCSLNMGNRKPQAASQVHPSYRTDFADSDYFSSLPPSLSKIFPVTN